MESTHTTWFLGSNSARGFHSLYNGFCSGDGDFLRVIKGGPGTGKSSFTARHRQSRRRCRALCRVHHMLRRPGTTLVDGIYIPDFHLGYADGTAPHVLDPDVFAADGDYLNIGEHCAAGGAFSMGNELRELNTGYKLHYRRAYELLAAAASVSPALTMSYVSGEERAAACSRAAGIAARELPKSGSKLGRGPIRRFLGGLTCKGRYLATDTLAQLCPRLFLLDNRTGLGFEFTGELARQAQERKLDAIICPHWLCPERIEAVIFPELGLGYAAVDLLAAYPEQHRRLHLDRMVSAKTLGALRPQLREDEKIEERLLVRAGQCLAAAKAVHDQLEAVYRPDVDFEALNRAVESEKRRIGL